MNNKPKERPIIIPSSEMVRAILGGRKTQHRWPIKNIVTGLGGWPSFARGPYHGNMVKTKYCPYGRPGDRLWIREAFIIDETPTEINGEFAGYDIDIWYKADDEVDPNLDQELVQSERWNSPIFMPKWASRITLEITEIRVERIQDISIKDILAEGIGHIVDEIQFDTDYKTWLRNEFKKLWDSTWAKKGFGWDTNCWVWVIEFKRIGSE